MKTFKRVSRHPSCVTKEKIRGSLKGRTKTDAEKEAISRGMKRYWADDTNFPADAEEPMKKR